MIDILWKILKIFIFILIVLMVLITFATEPKLSFDYYKAVTKSGVKVIGEIIKLSDYNPKPIQNATNNTL